MAELADMDRTFTLQDGRSNSAVIDNDFNPTFWGQHGTVQETLRTYETARFKVVCEALVCSHLMLDWLHTKYRIRGERLIIEKSARYTQADADKEPVQTLEYILQDHENLKKYGERHCNHWHDVEVFDFRVRVIHKGTGAEIGTGYLGDCIYDSYDYFTSDPYYFDIVHEAIEQARDGIEQMQL